MRKLYIRNLLIGLSFIIILSSAMMSGNGPGGGYSNAPNESNCTSCHGGSVKTVGNNWKRVHLYGDFTGNGYIPDSTYNITISHKQVGKSKFGFTTTVLDQNNSPVGTLTAVGSRNSKTTTTVSGQTRQYIQHTSTGTASVATDSTNWTFQWKAPSTNVGKVKFYVIVMSTNSNSSSDQGDSVYAKTFEIAPSSLLPVATASVSSGPYCTNTGIQLSGSGTNSPTSYSWRLTGGNPSTSSSQNPSVSYLSPGVKQAILTVKNAKGTSEPDTVSFTVLAQPSASIINGASGSVCENDSLLLTANTGASITYQWQHNNATSRSVYVKDTSLQYRVKVTSSTSGCSNTSGPFKLSWYPKPTISISRSGNSDSICAPGTVTFTASGTNLDSVIWYSNGVVVQRSKSLTYNHTTNLNASVYAIGKSVNRCLSAQSNTISLTFFKKLLPKAISVSKTTSSIHLAWDNEAPIVFVQYSLNKVNFSSPDTDSTLNLLNLNPSTKYDITIRSFQPGPCGYSDTTISVTTNACSNLAYIVDFNDRTCKGNSMNVRLLDLYKSKYSVSFNNGQFSQDTIYQFTPNSSDTLVITIIDSLSPTCPPIIEKIPFTIDEPVDNSTASTAKTIGSCLNAYTMTLPGGYLSYEFYKNNVLIQTTPDSTYTFQGLASGDQLTATGKFNSCSKTYGPVSFTLYPAAVATYGYTRNWKEFTFTADDDTMSVYKWTVNSNQIGSTATFKRDMSDFNNSNISLKLYVQNSRGCEDSTTQTVFVPNLTNINDVLNGALKVYPNPIVDELRIEADVDSYTVVIIDQHGREIQRMNGTRAGLIINAKDWAAGVYHVRISTEGQEYYGGTYIKQ